MCFLMLICSDIRTAVKWSFSIFHFIEEQFFPKWKKSFHNLFHLNLFESFSSCKSVEMEIWQIFPPEFHHVFMHLCFFKLRLQTRDHQHFKSPGTRKWLAGVLKFLLYEQWDDEVWGRKEEDDVTEDEMIQVLSLQLFSIHLINTQQDDSSLPH